MFLTEIAPTVLVFLTGVVLTVLAFLTAVVLTVLTILTEIALTVPVVGELEVRAPSHSPAAAYRRREGRSRRRRRCGEEGHRRNTSKAQISAEANTDGRPVP